MLRAIVTWHAAGKDVLIARNTTIRPYIVPETIPEAVELCRNQRIFTTAFYSFNMAELVSVFISGFLIILMSYVTPTLITRLRGRRHLLSDKAYLRQEGWVNDDILVVDSIALNSCGIGTWQIVSGEPILSDSGGRFQTPWLNRGLVHSTKGVENERTSTHSHNGLLLQSTESDRSSLKMDKS